MNHEPPNRRHRQLGRFAFGLGGYGFGGYVKEQENGAQLLGDFSRRIRRRGVTVSVPRRIAAPGVAPMVKRW